MASGETLVVCYPAEYQPRASNFATIDRRNSQLVLDFDGTADEEAYWVKALPRYYLGKYGLTVKVVWSASTATSGNVVWAASFERHGGGHDHDADSFAGEQTATAVANATSGVETETSIQFDTTQIDGLLAGEGFRLKLRRLGTHASDTMAGDAEVWRVEVIER